MAFEFNIPHAVQFGHENISTVILSLWQTQEERLSVTVNVH